MATNYLGIFVMRTDFSESILKFIFSYTVAEFSQQLEPDSRLFLQQRIQEVRLQPEDQLFFAELPIWLYFLCLATEETPDVFMVLPILQRIADCSPRIDLRILTQDIDFNALDGLLENEIAERDMPLLFILDEDWQRVAQWGPRPQAAEEHLDAWLAAHPQYQELPHDEVEPTLPLQRRASNSGLCFATPAQLWDGKTGLMADLIHLMRCWYQDDLTDQTVGEIRQITEHILADCLDNAEN